MSLFNKPKGSRDHRVDNTRSNRRQFPGNQFVDSAGKKMCVRTEPEFEGKPFDDIVQNPHTAYRIIEFFTVFTALSDILVCGSCKSKVTFKETPMRGVGFKIIVSCARCDATAINSGPMIGNGYEVNRRLILAMRLLAVSGEGINLFCNVMDIGKGFAKETYNRLTKVLNESCKTVFDFCCKKAVQEAIAENEKLEISPATDFPVSGDGTWKKRGHLSLFGVVTLIAATVKKCVALCVKSSFCQVCANNKLKKGTPEYIVWWADHESECSKNHSGSSGAMEPAAACELFKESKTKYGVRYSIYIGDGDSSTFKNITDKNPYDDELIVMKRECVGHVQKRMGTRLRNLKQKEKLGGAGKLTDSLVKELTVYYGLAIRRNIDSVENMRRDIHATYFHKISTDDKPRHEYCSPSWCWWQAREQARVAHDDPEYEAELEHDPPLNAEVAEKIWPIYEELSRDDLLERCLGGYTQNANESLNAIIWKFAPKHLHSGSKTVEIAAYIAASIFNEGFLAILWIMQDMKIEIGARSFEYAAFVHKRREKQKATRRSKSTHEARKSRIEALLEAEEEENDVDDMIYGPGIAD